jgi:hypothetical protein
MAVPYAKSSVVCARQQTDDPHCRVPRLAPIKANQHARRHLISYGRLDELYAIIGSEEAGSAGRPTFRSSTRKGRFAFIDTEHSCRRCAIPEHHARMCCYRSK